MTNTPSQDFKPVLIKSLLDDISDAYFSNIPGKVLDFLIEKKLTKFENEVSNNHIQDNIASALDNLNNCEKKAIIPFLDEIIDKDAYDLLMNELNSQIYQLKAELSEPLEMTAQQLLIGYN